MKNSCLQCGWCCKTIVIQIGYLGFLKFLKNYSNKDKNTIIKHWKLINKSEAIKRNPIIKDWILDGAAYFKCDLLTDNNKCSVHGNAPPVCSGYPLYNCFEGDDPSLMWYNSNCGYKK
jgi:Fe-S-cluster containining protein